MRVDVRLGLTLRLPGGDGFEMFKPEVALTDLDPEGDVVAQIAAGLATAADAYAAVDDQLGNLIRETLSGETSRPGYRERLEVAEKRLADVTALSNQLVAKLREHHERLKALGAEDTDGDA